MCGIVGYFGDQLKKKELFNMLDSIKMRGPDDSTLTQGLNYGLGFCRLAINTVLFGKQPILDAENNIIVCFNGEIYNYLELKSKLEKLGFIISSEVQVLLYLYILYGEKFVKLLDGDFAIVIINKKENFCLLIRDAIGVKPLYFSHHPYLNTWLFASHIAAFFNVDNFTSDFDKITLTERKVLGFWSTHRTLFARIKQVKPGQIIKIRGDNISHSLWSEKNENPSISVKSNLEMCHFALTHAIKKRITHTSVNPVLLALSGGVDSSIIAALAAQIDLTKLFYVTLFDKKNSQDGFYAHQVANDLKLSGISNNVELSGFFENIPKMIIADGGYGPSYSVYWIAKIAKMAQPDAKILLCGEGADEYFHGYSIHKNFINYWEQCKRKLSTLDYKIVQLSDLLYPFFSLTSLAKKNQYIDDILKQAQLVNMHLNPFDHSTMYHGLECRVPFLDYNLISTLQNIPSYLLASGGETKVLLKDILLKVFPKNSQISNSILHRHKIPAYKNMYYCRKNLKKYLSINFSSHIIMNNSLSVYARDLEDLFWLYSIYIIFNYYHGKHSNITLRKLITDHNDEYFNNIIVSQG